MQDQTPTSSINTGKGEAVCELAVTVYIIIT